MKYSATTPGSRQKMLDVLGVASVEELLASIPDSDRSRNTLDIEGPVAEANLRLRLEAMKGPRPRAAFLGGGLYPHYVPATVDSVAARSEWVTSYTPYQPELAQGTLTMYYEFQTYFARLTGQECANSGMYDGSTALAEAVLMAHRIRPRAKPVVYVSRGVHPQYRDVLATYARFANLEIIEMDWDRVTGRTRVKASAEDLADAVAVVFQSPNYFGMLDDLDDLAEGAFRIAVCTEALSLALLPPPRADVTVGEAQSFGIPMQLGGPTAGFFATKNKWIRKMPGRLVGRTVDASGAEAFCITLATREQFIRREKATSNICTASGLMCLRAAIYISLLGGRGLTDLARKNAATARFFVNGLADIGIAPAFEGPWFNECVLDLRKHPSLWDRLIEKDIVLGLPLEDHSPEFAGHILFCATEMHTSQAEELLQEIKSHV